MGALNERWAKIEFLCDFYKGTDVPLLKFGEEDYEALENDQLTVQGMMASRYVAQFEKEVSMWSVSLLNVADVFTCARGVPRRCLHFNTTRVHLTTPWVSSDAIRETCAAQDHQRDPADLELLRTSIHPLRRGQARTTRRCGEIRGHRR